METPPGQRGSREWPCYHSGTSRSFQEDHASTLGER